MKAIASLAFGILSSVGACMAAASVASHVVADSKSHTFNDLASRDLWTTTPVKVDLRQQHYERIPPLYSSYVTEAPTFATSKATPDSGRPSTKVQTPQPRVSAEHLAWCADRYRSFDPATNSYRSYGGETRECISPFQRIVAEADEGVGTKVNAQAAAWCAARYKSYRPEDNTYQPWEGPRRSCDVSHLVATSY
ncbi:BA14K family protein [Rhizobium leguminosarum]|uniref:BA14K family protein n=1 Tax=Rhizobium TaxID=379 RepID=UPI001389DDAA|nr:MULTISPECIES: BA14K family protein [Rhizobium]MBW8791445.1 BA14K family protein [Rhizobium leguminosarum]MBY5357499.1 BA14K family protein [Rhizobium leguminosarum]MBY5441916.1 BA14K family protein [Rhizobium leguminosarum]NDK52559.1 BA14K family protein [Rhizobium laguerreae]NNG73392.1 BA14K family protein [Rhizobium laguerreae]